MTERRRGVPSHFADHVDWAALPCALGDVVVRAEGGDEAWLAGALVLSEDAPAAVLFVAPEAGGDRAVYARPRPVLDLWWLAPVPAARLVAGPEPPTVIEIDGVVFDRARRLPLRVERVGEGAPDLQGTALVGEYAAARGDVAVLLVSGGSARCWTGVRLPEGDYDVWRPPAQG